MEIKATTKKPAKISHLINWYFGDFALNVKR